MPTMQMNKSEALLLAALHALNQCRNTPMTTPVDASVKSSYDVSSLIDGYFAERKLENTPERQVAARKALIAKTPNFDGIADFPRLENVSAISANFHGQAEKYQKFYDRYGDQLSGFAGIWIFCVYAAQAFTNVEPSQQYEDGYIEAVDAYVESIYAASLGDDNYVADIQNLDFLEPLAKAAIEKWGKFSPAGRFCLELQDGKVDDDAVMLYSEDDSWTARDRNHIDDVPVKWFPDRESAQQFIRLETFDKKDKVFVHEYDGRDGFVQTWQVKPLNRRS
jgi:hypothetical protein